VSPLSNQNTLRKSIKPTRFKSYFELITLFALTLVAFHFVVGFRVLNPINVTWLLGGDSAEAYLGWEFYRSAPVTLFPLGASPNFGVGFSSSIVFSDSIPLLAIPLKFVLLGLGGSFQYFGFWILSCFTLQVYFANRLIRLCTQQVSVRIVGALFFLFAPIFLYRLTFDGFGHLSLLAHFLILWALLLNLDKQASSHQWFWLLPISILIHFYLFGIVFVLFASNLISQMIQRNRPSIIYGLTKFLSPVVLSLALFYLAGGFMSNNAASDSVQDFKYKTSLTSFLDPQPGLESSWSALLPDIGDLQGSVEGFAFLGLVTLIALPLWFFGARFFYRFFRSGILSVSIATTICFIFALSPKISLASRTIFSYQVPGFIDPILSAFRSGGRFAWPAVYLLTLISFCGIAQISKRMPFHYMFISLLLVFQLWDMRDALTNTEERFLEDSFQTVLLDPMWTDLGSRYQNLVTVPPLNNDPNWIDFALLANNSGMTTNAAYVARADEALVYELGGRLQQQIENYDFSPDTLYVLTNYPPNPLSSVLLDLSGSSEIKGASVYNLDGFVVVAP
jgi:hypothetical protein